MSTKGEQTRKDIVARAVQLASVAGFAGLTIGGLASDLGLSKSGLFAHFRSKESLQLQVLTEAARRFADEIVKPAVREPRGEPRVRAMFERWLAWANSDRHPGGCLFVNASMELDDRPGNLRDLLVELQADWIGTLTRAAELAVEEGHFAADLDTRRFAFELYSLLLGRQLFDRLLRDPSAGRMTQDAFEALVSRVRSPS